MVRPDSPDEVDGEVPECLPATELIQKTRRASQFFFQDTTVADDASLNFCTPKFSTLEGYGDESFGIRVVCEREGDENVMEETDCNNDGDRIKKVVVPLYRWDGKMSRDRDVFSSARMDGSAFVGRR